MKPFLYISVWYISISAFAQPSQQGIAPSVLDSFQQCIERSVRLENLDSEAIYIGGMALAYHMQREYIRALELYDKAIKIGKEIGDTTIIAGNLLNIGMIYKDQGIYDKGLENLLLASTYFEKMHEAYGNPLDIPDLASCYNSIGDLYEHLEQGQLALTYYREGLGLYINSKDTFGIADALNFIGKYYKEIKLYDSALFYLDSALKVMELLKNPSITAAARLSIGEVYLQMNDLTKAESYFKSIVYNPVIGKTKSDKAIACYQLASLYTKQERFLEALQLTDRSIEYAQENTLKPLLLNNYKLKRVIYLKLKEYTSVVHYDSLYIQLKDEILDEQKNKALAEAQIRYETDKKEKELIILNQLKDVQSLRILILCISVALLMILSIVFIRGLRKEKKSNIRIKLLMQELNHRVKNNFTILHSILSIQKSKVNDVRIKEEIRSIENRLQSMINIHKRLYHNENITSIDLKLFIQDLVGDLKFSYGYKDRLRLNMQLESIHLNINQAIPLGLMMNEIISNAFKYAFKEVSDPALTISMVSKDSKWIVITIEDNGNGKVEELDNVNNESFGLSMIRLLARQIHARVNIQSEAGVRYELIIEKNTPADYSAGVF